jgi:glutamate/tyrosine decarboxylase-like PLP-dependent enzyme
MANITALIVARNSFISEGTELNVRKNGLKNLSAQMVLYCSSETHNSMQKAAEAIGLGSDAMRKIAVNDKYEIKIDQLEKAILKDKAQGLIPFCVVANCGSVNTGAIDDLNAIYDLCQKYNLWMHVDGAFGAAAKLTDEFSERLKIIEKADSLAFDFHKWFYVNYEVGCLLVRDAKKHRAAFATAANYLVTHERGLISGPDGMSNYGLELSRGFKALKIWMMFKEYGSSKFKKLIRQNIAQVHYLGDILRAEKKLELLNDPVLNVVCYRFNHFPSDHILSETEATYLDNLNKELLQRLQEQGIALPSATTLNNHYAIRVCITNHRTRKSDLEILAKESVRIGADILKENRI